MSLIWGLSEHNGKYQMTIDLPPDAVKLLRKELEILLENGYLRFSYDLTKEDVLNFYNQLKDYIEKHELCY